MSYTTIHLFRLLYTYYYSLKLALFSSYFPSYFPLIFPLFSSSYIIYPYALCPYYLGPMGTPYQNGCFEFDVFLPADYPNTPPKVSG